jgi:tetratricopeptide (TPR) repeat protein
MGIRRWLTVAVLFSASIGEAGQERPAKTPPADYCAVPSNTRPTLPAVLMAGMGETDFPITTSSKEAQAFFNQGVSQMHSFWFRESERSFMQAAELDPGAAMAYWGIAMSAAGDYRPAFQLMRNRSRMAQPEAGGSPSAGETRAREAIARAVALKDQVTERERLYIDAVAARRNPDSKDRDGDYVRGMRKLVAAYPDDLEAKSVLALAIQRGYDSVTKEPRDTTMESLALLREVLARNPNHFGAHHYIIHGCEGGKRPQDAWASCKRYPELVPNIPHALHMPGHIYAQSDRLEDAAHAFASAGLNELTYMAGDTLYGNGHYGHNQHFLIHTLGLQGRYREAMTRAAELMRQKENPRERASVDGSSAYRQGWFCAMKTLVRFEKWDEILDGKTLAQYDRPRENAWLHWARGLAQASRSDAAGAAASLADMDRDLELVKGSAKDLPPQLEVARLELEGYLDVHRGKVDRGLELLRKAAGLEAALIYTEPPAYPRPVVEMLGRAALGVRNYKEAESAYRKALEQEPGSGRALYGLAQSLDGLERRGDAVAARLGFTRAWSSADSDLPQMQEPGAGSQKPGVRTAVAPR